MADLNFERQLHAAAGFKHIAGLDEAGRGSLAGPVTAAAVILPFDDDVAMAALRDVNDSKTLSPARREFLYTLITNLALATGIGSASPIRIDQEGIMSATRHAMYEALKHLGVVPDYLLIDGRIRLGAANIPQKSIIKGDRKSLSIAAASILAKVTRDRYMTALATLYPQYGFERHKGYATPQHLAALAVHGPTNLHRHTYSPIRPRLVEP